MTGSIFSVLICFSIFFEANAEQEKKMPDGGFDDNGKKILKVEWISPKGNLAVSSFRKDK